jgi:hypothetical protein
MTICYISILQLRIFVKAKINLKSTPYFATMMLKLKRRVYNAFIPTSADRNTKNDKLLVTHYQVIIITVLGMKMMQRIPLSITTILVDIISQIAQFGTHRERQLLYAGLSDCF